MATEPPLTNETANETLSLLQTRLHRLEFYLTGATSGPPQTTPSIYSRLQDLESGLRTLSSKHPLIQEILSLQSYHPSIFPPSSSSINDTSLSPTEQITTLLSLAPLFPASASQLQSLRDLPVPSSDASRKLIELKPRMERVGRRQEEVERECNVLRVRTEEVLRRWVEVQVLGSGECWVEWEERVGEVEKGVRRREGEVEREGVDV